MVDDESRPEKFGLWLSKFTLVQSLFSKPEKTRIIVLSALLITHVVYWATAWISPWPFLIFQAIGIWFGQGIFKPWITIISQAMQPEWDASLFKIVIPFIVINYIAIFACLYMFGTIVDSNGIAITGMWEHFYFSAVTLTTLGYGNLTPLGTWTEIIATIEAIIGFMGFAVMAGIVASIVFKRIEKDEKS